MGAERRGRGRRTDLLGSTRTLLAETAASLHAQAEEFIDSTNDSAARALWPLVKRVRLQGPWEVLAGSVVLVDAPGVQGARAPRARARAPLWAPTAGPVPAACPAGLLPGR
jgi:hypothetical protein